MIKRFNLFKLTSSGFRDVNTGLTDILNSFDTQEAIQIALISSHPNLDVKNLKLDRVKILTDFKKSYLNFIANVKDQ